MTNEELTKKAFELDERITRHTEQIKTCFNRIGDLTTITESVQKLAISVELLAHEQKDIGKKVDGLSTDLEEIKHRPGRRWESIVSVAITVVVTAMVTYALARAGL